MLTDPRMRAGVPPWGGEGALELLSLLDFDAIGAAEPTWLVGYSDTSTLMLPLTLRTGVATLHAPNLMDAIPGARSVDGLARRGRRTRGQPPQPRVCCPVPRPGDGQLQEPAEDT